jgi:hypothetical protein
VTRGTARARAGALGVLSSATSRPGVARSGLPWFDCI